MTDGCKKRLATITTDILCGQTKHHEQHTIRNELNLVFCTNYFSSRSGDPLHFVRASRRLSVCVAVTAGSSTVQSIYMEPDGWNYNKYHQSGWLTFESKKTVVWKYLVFRKVWAYPSMFDVSVSDLLLKCLYSFKNFFIFPGFHSFCLFVRSFYSWKIGKIAKKFFEDRFESLKNYYEKETLLLHQALLTVVCLCLIVFFLRFELPSKFVFFLSRWQTEATLDVVGHSGKVATEYY